MYAKTRVTSKYQITLPKSVRKQLRVDMGDEIVFEDAGDSITLKVDKRIDPVEAIDGILEGENLVELKAKAASRLTKKKLGLE